MKIPKNFYKKIKKNRLNHKRRFNLNIEEWYTL